jgi:pSer/pThr/pTyr-binding forkhead associated (FHA) protein
MKKVTLRIENQNESHIVELADELSIGRTNLAQLVLDDHGLSRLNTTIFRDGDEILIVDENSTNGTFVGGERIYGAPRPVNDRDEIKLGNHTTIYVEFFGNQSQSPKPPTAETPKPPTIDNLPIGQTAKPKENKQIPVVLLAAGAMFFVIIIAAVATVLLIDTGGKDNKNTATTRNTPVRSSSDLLIPIRVIDPLGGQDPDDLDDIISSLEGVEEEKLDASNVDEVQATTASGAKDTELTVPIEYWQKQRDLALGARGAATGLDPGLKFFPELVGGNVAKQKAKLSELIAGGYKQPMDFSDLAEKRLKGELIELPIATQWYLLDVGGSASENPFTAFSFQMGDTPIAAGSAKYLPLDELSKSFQGQKYDLNNGRDRRQIRIRLLRMFHPRAKPILEELAKAYQAKFGRPLRVTSLTRSMDYQIGLNKINPNSFNVKGPGSLPPHTSGCAFDLARKHMTADEQNFLQEKLVEMEKRGVLDALREGGANACFHVFIYPDGRPPKM